LIHIAVDFNTMNSMPNDKVYICTVGNEPLAIKPYLQSGETVLLFDEELAVEAVIERVEFREGYQAWLGNPNWATQKER
jgi:hypothetical protein